jgi:hypothetical protein
MAGDPAAATPTVAPPCGALAPQGGGLAHRRGGLAFCLSCDCSTIVQIHCPFLHRTRFLSAEKLARWQRNI